MHSFSWSAGHFLLTVELKKKCNLFCCNLGAKLLLPFETPDLHIFCQANGFLMKAVCVTGVNCPQNQWATARGNIYVGL